MFKNLAIRCPWIRMIRPLSGETRLAKAIDTERGQEVLLKVLSLSSGGRSAHNHWRCQSLSLPVPQLYNCFRFEDAVILECEYVPGSDLHTMVVDRADEELPLQTILEQLLLEVKGYQRYNLSHLDIKPENVIWDSKTQKARLIDFESMQKHTSQGLTREVMTSGTSAYMSPEILRKSRIHRNTDLWGIGILGLTILLEYNPIMTGDVEVENLRKYSHQRLLTEHHSEELVALITSLLHVNPEKRCWITDPSIHQRSKDKTPYGSVVTKLNEYKDWYWDPNIT